MLAEDPSKKSGLQAWQLILKALFGGGAIYFLDYPGSWSRQLIRGCSSSAQQKCKVWWWWQYVCPSLVLVPGTTVVYDVWTGSSSSLDGSCVSTSALQTNLFLLRKYHWNTWCIFHTAPGANYNWLWATFILDRFPTNSRFMLKSIPSFALWHNIS